MEQVGKIGDTVNNLQGESIGQILHIAAKARRHEINRAVYSALSGRVASGPFEGMILPDQSSWLDGDIAPKLLGFYEAELHTLMMQVVQSNYSIVVNVGCADGYYAVGLARLMPYAKVYAYDISEESQKVCRAAARKNGVAERISVGGCCDADTLSAVVPASAPAFVMLDCEGAEKDLLDPDRTPVLRTCDFVAECHDFYDRDISPAILRRFEESHHVTVISEGPRNPNSMPILNGLSSLDRWLTVCEFRPETMHWLVGLRK
jgi:hypothetical protein